MTPAPKRIPIAGPSITDLEVEYVSRAARDSWQDGAGVWERRFEEAFARYVGRRFAVALPSCTAGLHLALAALGIGEGDEVVVPDATWIATAAPISYVGAEPCFADVDTGTWGLSPRAFERAIGPRTRAAIVVDLYGTMPDWPALEAVASEHGIALLEDAAEAIGASIGARRAGSFGAFSLFSFHGSKTLTTGEGGMLVTDDRDLQQRVLVLRDHGREPGDRWFWNGEVAFKYRMSALQAALGLAQLERVEALVEGKRRLFAWYRERLGDLDDVTLNPQPQGTRSAYWMVTAVAGDERIRRGFDKRAVMESLDALAIATRPFFHCLSDLPAYAASKSAARARTENETAHKLSAGGINLPSGLQLEERDVDRVCSAYRAVLQTAARPSMRPERARAHHPSA